MVTGTVPLTVSMGEGTTVKLSAVSSPNFLHELSAMVDARVSVRYRFLLRIITIFV